VQRERDLSNPPIFIAGNKQNVIALAQHVRLSSPQPAGPQLAPYFHECTWHGLFSPEKAIASKALFCNAQQGYQSGRLRVNEIHEEDPSESRIRPHKVRSANIAKG
jgi:hypothetical protein